MMERILIGRSSLLLEGVAPWSSAEIEVKIEIEIEIEIATTTQTGTAVDVC